MPLFDTTLSLVASFVHSFGRKPVALTVTPRDPTRPLVFTHIPKTSGTSIMHGLLDALGPSQSVGGFDMSQFGEASDFGGVNPELLNSIYRYNDDLPKGADFISGHFAASTTFSNYPQAQHITVLREPLSRVLSHYLYWRGLDDEALQPWGELGTRVRASHAPLADFLADKSLACQIDNIYVRMMLWPHFLIPDSDWIDHRDDDQLVDEALHQLDAYAYVDIIENPTMQSSLHEWLGGDFSYSKMNVTATLRPELRLGLDGQLTPETTGLLIDRSRLDQRLWEAVAAKRSASVTPAQLQLMALLPTIARYGQLTGKADSSD